jgi:hypothetical protein
MVAVVGMSRTKFVDCVFKPHPQFILPKTVTSHLKKLVPKDLSRPPSSFNITTMTIQKSDICIRETFDFWKNNFFPVFKWLVPLYFWSGTLKGLYQT